jgi:hypothetical protein
MLRMFPTVDALVVTDVCLSANGDEAVTFDVLWALAHDHAMRPSHDRLSTAPAPPTGGVEQRNSDPGIDAPAVSPSASTAHMGTCSICMEAFNESARRPVLCTSCGNSMCLACWTDVRVCPMCSGEKPSRPVFNIALEQLVAPGTS